MINLSSLLVFKRVGQCTELCIMAADMSHEVSSYDVTKWEYTLANLILIDSW